MLYYYEVSNIKNITESNSYREVKNNLEGLYPNQSIIIVELPSDIIVKDGLIIGAFYKSYNKNHNTLLRVKITSIGKYVSAELIKNTTSLDIKVINMRSTYFKQFFELTVVPL